LREKFEFPRKGLNARSSFQRNTNFRLDYRVAVSDCRILDENEVNGMSCLSIPLNRNKIRLK